MTARQRCCPSFTAAQAAQKINLLRIEEQLRFTAAQAAQKIVAANYQDQQAFTAAQAAQKS